MGGKESNQTKHNKGQFDNATVTDFTQILFNSLLHRLFSDHDIIFYF